MCAYGEAGRELTDASPLLSCARNIWTPSIFSHVGFNAAYIYAEIYGGCGWLDRVWMTNMLLRGVCVCLPALLNVFVRIGCKLHAHFFYRRSENLLTEPW